MTMTARVCGVTEVGGWAEPVLVPVEDEVLAAEVDVPEVDPLLAPTPPVPVVEPELLAPLLVLLPPDVPPLVLLAPASVVPPELEQSKVRRLAATRAVVRAPRFNGSVLSESRRPIGLKGWSGHAENVMSAWRSAPHPVEVSA